VGHDVPMMVGANDQSDFGTALRGRSHETVSGGRLEAIAAEPVVALPSTIV